MESVEVEPAGAGRSDADRAARLAVVQLALAILALSFTPILFRWSELGPNATAFYRAALTLPVFAVWSALERRGKENPGRLTIPLRARDRLLLALGGALFAANISTYAWAVHLTSIANASLLSNLAPIFVTLGSFLLFRERVSRAFIAALVAAFAGVAVLTSEKLGIDSGQVRGDGLGVLSSFAFAAYLMTIGRLRLRLTSSTIMVGTAGSTALCLGVLALATGDSLIPRTPAGVADLLALALVSHALGQGLLTVALAHVGATFSAVSLLSLPVTAALYGWLIFSEPLSVNQAIGAVIVLGSILAARLAKR